MAKQHKKPELRFNGFEEDWEEGQLKDAVDYNSTGLRACDVSKDGLYDLYDANESIGKVKEYVSEKPFISIIKDGSGVGRVRLLPGFSTCLGTMGCMKSREGYDTNFIYSHLQKKDFSRHIISGAIPHVYFSEYGEDEFKSGKYSEQQKIGEFFMELDELIKAKEQEVEKLRQIKQALLDKMFPNTEPHETKTGGVNLSIDILLQTDTRLVRCTPSPLIPAIRFRGYSKKWENKTFGDYGEINMCKRIMKYQTNEKGDVPFFKIGTFGGTPDAYIPLSLFLEYKQKYPYPRKGDILVSAAGTIGRVVEFSGENEYFQDSNIVWLNHNQQLDNSFLKVLYSVVKWNGLEGSTLKRLYNNNFLQTQIVVPSDTDEQFAIGQFFREQDNTIYAAQAQIIRLRNIKQACLQKMFA